MTSSTTATGPDRSAPARTSSTKIRLALALLIAGFAIGCTPPDLTAYQDQARVALNDGDFTHAQRVIRAGLEKNTEDLGLLLLAVDLYAREDPPQFSRSRLALHYARRALDSAPDDARSHLAVARCYRAAGVPAEAERVLASAAERFPEDPAVQQELQIVRALVGSP